ncbi:hypothetical protein RRG08_019352 [Elysia crispata]|uniref:Uncharacterized protein n=1 Tax=Elysia crispata TaxID=231223 RepID=A0AAE1B4R4_9GAST|nr:hypothetical protein RRG08_019352 [Elysia crispata]
MTQRFLRAHPAQTWRAQRTNLCDGLSRLAIFSLGFYSPSTDPGAAPRLGLRSIICLGDSTGLQADDIVCTALLDHSTRQH